MHKREEIDNEAEALLDSMHGRELKKEKSQANKNDEAFFDEDGNRYVEPTYEEIASLVENSSMHALPMKEILRRNLKVTLRAIELAEIAYHANPRQGTATALTSFQSTVRDLVVGIEDRQDPSVLFKELVKLAIQPLFQDFIKVLTAEAARKRTSLLSIIPEESSHVVVHEMDDLLKGVSAGLDEAYERACRKLEDILGVVRNVD